MKKLIVSLLCVCCSLGAFAQKWLSKARKAVCTVTVYDKDGKMMNTGNCFFIDEKGTALSDYALFKGAYSADVVNGKGDKYKVDFILGASELYDVVKFHVATGKDKMEFLTPGTAVVNEKVYLMPYATQNTKTCATGTVKEVSKVDSLYHYYTFALPASAKQVSCPVMNEQGNVVGLMQRFKDTPADICYGLDTRYEAKLLVGAMSVNDYNLNDIHIRKALPSTPTEAEVFLMMKQPSVTPAEYLELVNQYIAQFPEDMNGYLRRATYYINEKKYAEAEQDMQTYADLNPQKDDAHYNIGRLLYNLCLYRPDAKYKDWTMDKALAETNEAYSMKTNPVYLSQKGDILFAQKKYKEAYDCFIGVTKTPLRSAASFFSASRCLQMAGDSISRIMALQDSAVNCFTKPYPNEAAPYILNRALMRSSIGQYRPAVEDFNEYEHIMAGNVNDEFYYNRSVAEMQCRMYQQAIDDIVEALERNKNVLAYRVQEASLYVLANEIDKALAAAKAAVALDAKSADAYRLLGYCQAKKGLKSEALTNLNKAKELGDTNAEKIIKEYLK